MDPLTQATLGSAFAESAADRRRLRAFALAGAVSGLAPDLDVLIRSSTDPLLYLEYHRQFTHALVFIPAGAALCALLLHPLLRGRLKPAETGLACLLGYGSHGLLDACTSYGTQLFWPFSDVRIAWNWISVVDPLFSLPLLLMVMLAAVRQQRAYAFAGLGWALVYLGLGVVQHERALSTAHALAQDRGHDPARLLVKPGFANLLIWKSVYEADGRYYVDGIRAGLTKRVCEGEHTDVLDPSAALPWLESGNRQGRDLQRFAKYSEGWLALDTEDAHYVVDVRYASLPHRIDGLWGIRLDPEAPADAPVVWHVERARRSEGLSQMFALMAGRDCRPL